MLIYNPTITFSQNLFHKLFQDFHRHGEKICLRSGSKSYPKFLMNGKLVSLNLEFPRLLRSPIIKIPPNLKVHADVRHEQVAKLDLLLVELFPVDEAPPHVLLEEWSVSRKVLRTLMLSFPGSLSSFDEITAYLSASQLAEGEANIVAE